MLRRFAAVIVMVAVVACTGEDPATVKSSTKPHSTVKGKVSPTPTPKGSPSARASEAPASPTPSASISASPTAKPSPSPSPSPTPTPSPTPVVAVSAPPIAFPYTKVGATWTYDLTVSTKLGDVSGEVTITVKTVTPGKSSDLTCGFVILKAPPLVPGIGTKNTKNTTVDATTTSPYALGVLFPTAGVTVTDVVTATVKENHTVPLGAFDATKYTIKETTGTNVADVLLWTDVANGAMLEQQITGSKLPSLPGLEMVGSLISGTVTTTLKLKGQGTSDPGASGVASPKPSP